jgi:CheY-like chemotaxis protein
MILSDLRSLLQNLPAIFMSAAFTPQIRADAFALGARACLDKPLDIRALRCAVQEIIDHELL